MVRVLDVGGNGCFDSGWDLRMCCGGAGACGDCCGDVGRWCDGELVERIDWLGLGWVVVVVVGLLGEGDVVEEIVDSIVLRVDDGEELVEDIVWLLSIDGWRWLC